MKAKIIIAAVIIFVTEYVSAHPIITSAKGIITDGYI